MTINILMPALSPTMEKGNISRWLVAEGDYVNPGDIIAEIETDKATMEVEAVDEGRIDKIVVGEGSQGVKINSVIAILVQGDGNDCVSTVSSSPDLQLPFPDESDDSSNCQVSSSLSLEHGHKFDDKSGQVNQGEDTDFAKSSIIPVNMETESITVRQALCDAMAEEMRIDPEVFIMGEEVGEYQGAYKVTQGLLEEFGKKRVVDTPITEHGFTGLGVGAAISGIKPIVEFMTFNFSMQAVDQIINSAAKTLYMSGGQINVPIVFRGPNGAAVRVAAQHSQCYAAWYSHIPGLKVVMPYRACDAKGLLKAAIRDPNPVVFLENEVLYGHTFEVPKVENHLVPIGKGRIHRSGSDVTLISFGIGMTYTIEAAKELLDMGIDAEIIDLLTIRPMDLDIIITSVMKTGRCVTVEEGFPQSSVGSHIACQIMQRAFDYLDAPVITVCGKDVPMPYAANLEKLALPSVSEIIEAVKKVTYT